MSSAFASSPDRSPAVPGSVGIRLVAVAGASPRNPLASSYVVERLAPGRGSLAKWRSTTTPIGAWMFRCIRPLRPSCGAISSSRRAEAETSFSRWTSVSQDVVHLGRGSEAFETLTINVPSSASSGERFAVLWAEVSAPPAGGITLVNRVGVRMYLSIGPGGRHLRTSRSGRSPRSARPRAAPSSSHTSTTAARAHST